MTHNLVIANDKNAENVQFTVSIPDNYDTFKIDYINGSVINQNYLKVGDVLTFKFSNNPITYDNTGLKVNITYNNAFKQADPRNYEFIENDTFNIYRICYMPIFTFWNERDKQIEYIYNPCDANLIFDEPLKNIPPYRIFPINGGATPIYISFSGSYVIGLRPTPNNKIEDINITIGDSINNSKMKPQDLGNYSIASGVVNNLVVQQIRQTAYNYGATWNYPINNLIMKHKETIIYDTSDIVDYKLIAALNFEHQDQIEYITTNLSFATINIINSEYTVRINRNSQNTVKFQQYKDNEPYISDLTHAITTSKKSIETETLAIVKQISNNPITYQNIFNNENIIIDVLGASDGFIVKGSEMATYENYGLFCVDDSNNSIIAFNPTQQHFINPDWFYSGNSLNILVEYYDEIHDDWRPLEANNNVLIKPVNQQDDPRTKPRLITCEEDNEYIAYYENQPLVDMSIRFRVFDENINDYVFNDSDPYKFYIIGPLKTVDGIPGNINIIKSINTGTIIRIDRHNPHRALNGPENIYYYNLRAEAFSYPIQLLDNVNVDDRTKRSSNNSDILARLTTKNGKNGIKLTTPKLNNNEHIINVNNETVNNKVFKWFWASDESDNPRDLPLIPFIPKKTRNRLIPYIETSYQHGFFKICDLNGMPTTDLIDSQTDIFIANGHESLNIEPPDDTDGKIKTFNGSLCFDRSDSRITRLFSNDLTGSALGYLNDILAAKLSRYYFVASYNTFNSFFDTNQKMIINRNHRTIYNYYKGFKFYTGQHELILSSCGDLVKIIGSENLVNNCFSCLMPEEQYIKTNPITMPALITSRESLNHEDYKPFYYKLFHLYTGGLDEEPYNGYSVNDSDKFTIGGLNLLGVDTNKLLLRNTATNKHKNLLNSAKLIYENDNNKAYDNYEKLRDDLINQSAYESNRDLNDYGVISTLPAFRLYKNANFEQSDLTITTGGIKTLHPIYLQSTPKILINNISYMIDFIIDNLRNQYGTIKNEYNIFDYINVVSYSNTAAGLYNNANFPILRFGKLNNPTHLRTGNINVYIAESFDSLFILNYINTDTINNYESLKDLSVSIPNKDNQNTDNEEFIYNIDTSSEYINIQLFSSRYFKFLDNVGIPSMALYKSSYIEAIDNDTEIIKLYYSSNANIPVYNELINNIACYNNLKGCKLFICKLGEFLQFPKILYGSANCFNESVNVSVNNLTATDYKPAEFDNINNDKLIARPEQKINVYMFGVMFRYHQQALGYQNLANELPNEYKINKALGNRQFILKVYDEYGREIPNTDTSQGFKNNLYLEITLI